MIRLLMYRLTGRSTALIALETILIVSAVALAAYLRLGEWALYILLNENGVGKTLLVALVCQVCLYYADLYDLWLVSDRRELFVRIVQALGSASFILAALYFWFPSLILGRGVFMIAAVLIITLVVRPAGFLLAPGPLLSAHRGGADRVGSAPGRDPPDGRRIRPRRLRALFPDRRRR